MKSNIKNIKESAERIHQAVKDNERIFIYGDSDLYGIASTVILQEAIKTLGGSVAMVMFPNREDDGYGVNARAVEFLKTQKPGLFITLDLGITNAKEVDALNSFG